MTINTKDWLNYVNKLRRLSSTAAEKMQQYIQRHGFSDTEAIIDFAYALVTKYGEGSAELAAQMYDEIAQLSGVLVSPAEPAATATMEETARAIQGSLIQSPTGQKLTQVADRLVKQAAADTTLKNAKRDGAEWAWVPMGDTCGFCITLASRGWQRASQAQMRGNHASHIHAHCDCQFSIRFNGKGGVKGYDPDVYKKMYDEAEGSSSAEKVKSLRRSLEDRDKINAQKRAAYAKRKGDNSGDKGKDEPFVRIPQFAASSVIDKVKSGEYSLKLSKQQYDKHKEGTPDYERYKNSRIEKGLSPQSKLILSYEECQNIVEKYSGTGIIRANSKGEPMNIEDITCDKIVGYYMQKGEWVATYKAALHHGSKGTHIVPQKGNNYD